MDRRERGQRGWLKWAMAMWVAPQMLLAQRVRPGPSGDFSDLVPLASAATSIMPFDQLLADAGYDSEDDHRFCHGDLRLDSLIPAKGGDSCASSPPRTIGRRWFDAWAIPMIKPAGKPIGSDGRQRPSCR